MTSARAPAPPGSPSKPTGTVSTAQVDRWPLATRFAFSPQLVVRAAGVSPFNRQIVSLRPSGNRSHCGSNTCGADDRLTISQTTVSQSSAVCSERAPGCRKRCCDGDHQRARPAPRIGVLPVRGPPRARQRIESTIPSSTSPSVFTVVTHGWLRTSSACCVVTRHAPTDKR